MKILVSDQYLVRIQYDTSRLKCVMVPKSIFRPEKHNSMLLERYKWRQNHSTLCDPPFVY